MSSYDLWENGSSKHHKGHPFPTATLSSIESLLPTPMICTAETGCGKSTILFSNISAKHFVFALNDTSENDMSSVNFYRDCPITKPDVINEVFGPTQLTLPGYKHTEIYDCVLIDGPHGYPFPDLEYFFFYPHIRKGGFLIIDDVNIPTIGRMADFLSEDEMWKLLDIFSNSTAVFQRTDAPTTNPLGDEWWTQRFNKRRVSKNREIYLHSPTLVDTISSLNLDEKVHG